MKIEPYFKASTIMNHHTVINRMVNETMPAETYHGTDALSKSTMTKALKSPAHYQAALMERSEPSKAMQLGTAIHTSILEPALYSEIVAILPSDIDGRTKEGKVWREANKSRIQLTVVEHVEVQGVAHSVRSHPFWDIITLPHKIEASVFGQDLETGLALKARPDLWVNETTLVDIKTTDDASPEAFTRTIATFRYHIQAAHYLAMTGAEEFYFVAVERKAPYAVAIYKLDSEWLQAGEILRRNAIMTIHECRALDSWPAYPTATQTLSCPKWALNKSET
jgi:exodeoxyribonuclease VIII